MFCYGILNIRFNTEMMTHDSINLNIDIAVNFNLYITVHVNIYIHTSMYMSKHI